MDFCLSLQLIFLERLIPAFLWNLWQIFGGFLIHHFKQFLSGIKLIFYLKLNLEFELYFNITLAQQMMEYFEKSNKESHIALFV